MAGSSPIPEEGKKKARIEIIPLIDVIFFLLATFVLFVLSLNRLVEIPVTLPKAAVNPGPPDPHMVILQMSGGTTCYWKQGQEPSELIPRVDILPRLEQYAHQTDNPKVLVAGDDQAKFGETVYALDQVRKAGIQQVSVETQTRPTGR
ncbi:MAG: ExbD/TolR family protein [Opitutaceae bacterium]